MRNSFFIVTFVICFVCYPLFAATRTNEMCLASFTTNEQTQQTECQDIGKITAYLNGNHASMKTFHLFYVMEAGETVYKIKAGSYEYIVAPNPSYDSYYDSGKNSFKYIAGNYYFNLGLKNIQAQQTDWKSLGEVVTYKDGNTYTKKTFRLYITKTGEAVYKIKAGSYEYIVAPNPSYDSDCNSGKNSFKYLAGNYYFNLDPKSKLDEL